MISKNGKYDGDLITVYTEQYKKYLLSSKICEEKIPAPVKSTADPPESPFWVIPVWKPITKFTISCLPISTIKCWSVRGLVITVIEKINL